MRVWPVLALAALATRAHAQPAPEPVDPYAAPPAVRPSEDPVLGEQVAQALVARAQELLDARVFADAKQLAVEALVKSPKGLSADHARYIIRAVNQALGIREDAPPKPAEPPPAVDLTPIQDPTTAVRPPVPPVPPTPEGAGHPSRAIAVHGALYASLLGATIGSFISDDNVAGGAVPVAIGAGVAAVVFLPGALAKLHWSEAQVRTAGAGTVWGGVLGGLIADLAKTDGTSAREVLIGSSIGATVGGVGGALLARQKSLTRGDVALVDTFAGMGAVGGLTIGMLMQPAETEAYSLNAMLGTAGGVVVGLVAAPRTNTTPRRMLRVAGAAALGGAAPFLLYAGIYDSHSNTDERVTGALSTAGLAIGAYIGFRLTAHMDEGLDTLDGAHAPTDDAPAAVLGRHSDGRWALNGLGLSPLSRDLSPQKGIALQLLGARF